MSTPSQNGHGPQAVAVFDPGHPFTGNQVPAQLVTELVQTTRGQMMALTLRIPNTTVSVLLAKDDAQMWADQIRSKIAEMNGLILPPSG
jgi:hypothetical protein